MPPYWTGSNTRRLKQGIRLEANSRGLALMENRSGLLADALRKRGSGHSERVAALTMIEPPADRPGSNTSVARLNSPDQGVMATLSTPSR